MNPITNRIQLDQLNSNTTIYAVIVAVVAIALIWLVANMIPWKGGKDRSYIIRRIWWVIIGALAPLGFWLYNQQVVLPHVKNAGLQNMFSHHNMICLFVVLGIYLIGSVLLMFVFRHSKLGSILGKEKNA